MASCPNCGNRLLRKHPHFCSSCGLDLSKEKSFLNLDPKTMLTIVAILIIGSIALSGLILFLVFTPGEFNSSSFSSEISVVGNGVSEVQIEITLKNKLGFPMTDTEIQATASKGTIHSCKTNEQGVCTIVFVPPKTSNSTSSEIILSSSAASKEFIIQILPDFAESISLTVEDLTILADGISGTKIIAEAKNNIGNNVPDETIIYFELDPVGAGSFSKDSCLTLNGSCSVTYVSSTEAGEVTISAVSGSITKEQAITLESLPPKEISITLSNNSLIGDGNSEAMVTVYLQDNIGRNVQNYPVFFETNLGSIEGNCTTKSDGKCYVTYTSAYSTGQATITATSGNVSASELIALIGFSDLYIELSPTPNVGDPIYPAFAMNHEYLGEHMLVVEIFNEGTDPFSGQMTVSIPGWSSEQTQQLDVPALEEVILYFDPPLNSDVFENLQTQSTLYKITVINNEGDLFFQSSTPVDLKPYNAMPWYSPYFGSNTDPHNDLIISWVTPEAPEIHQLLSDAADHTPSNSILGYQKYSTGCGASGTSSCTQEESTYIQMEAIYIELQDRGVHYVNAPGNYFSDSQTVYTPVQSLEVGGANCIDGSLVFASAIVSAGMHAYLILVPGHSFVCVRASPTSEYISCVETTMIGSGASFDDAVTEGADAFNDYGATGEINILDVNSILADGVNSLPN